MPLSEPLGPSDGRVLLLTGAAGGIGGAILRRARQDGYRVFAIDVADSPVSRVDPLGKDRFARGRGQPGRLPHFG